MTQSSPRPWGIPVAAGVAVSTMAAALPMSVVQASPVRPATVQNVVAAAKSQTGKLHIKVYGLPKGSKAKVRVSGPGAFTKKVPKTTTLVGLKPGTYRVSASQVSVNGKKYKAAVKPKAKVTVKKNKVAKVRVRHVSKTPGSSVWPPTSPSPSAQPLKFNLANAAGVAVPDGTGRSRAGSVSVAPDGASLLAIAPTGQMTNALTSGEIPDGVYISATFPGPEKKMAVAYGGVPTMGSREPWCTLGLVDRKTGDQTCLELSRGGFAVQPSRVSIGGYPGVQFDAQGRVYYEAIESASGTSKYIIRRHDGSAATDLIGYGGVYLNGWIVASDGTVVVSGNTYSSDQAWTRAIAPNGAIQSLPEGETPIPAQFPDGNVYLLSKGGGVRRYLVDQRQMESGFWIADSRHFTGEILWDSNEYCTTAANVYCAFGGSGVNRIVTTRSQEVWGISSGTALRLYPSPAIADLGIKPGVMTAVGNRIAVGGTDSTGNQITVLYNPANGVKKTLLGPPSRVEVFSLNYTASSGLIMFDGVRYSDGRYVVGAIDPSTGDVSMDAAAKMSQVITFDE